MVQVAVCGPARCTDDEARAAFDIGRLLAGRGHRALLPLSALFGAVLLVANL